MGAQGEEGTPAGWYDDPATPGTLRWWDGAQWTAHVQSKPTAPASPPARLSRAGLPLPWLLGGIAAIAVVVLAASGVFDSDGGEDADGAAESAATQVEAVDADAKEAARTAQTAIETYALDHNGSYSGASSEDLQTIEPTLAERDVSLTADRSGYTITVTAEDTGNEFTLTKDPSGQTVFSCSEDGEGGCPEGGNWGAPPPMP